MKIPILQTKLVESGFLDLPRIKVYDTEAASIIGRHLIGDADREHMLALLIDNSNQIRGIHTVAIGMEGKMYTNPSCFFRAAIVHGATGMIMIHNHPSGSTLASQEDIIFYQKVKNIGELIGISVLDSIIVTRTSSYGRVQDYT